MGQSSDDGGTSFVPVLSRTSQSPGHAFLGARTMRDARGTTRLIPHLHAGCRRPCTGCWGVAGNQRGKEEFVMRIMPLNQSLKKPSPRYTARTEMFGYTGSELPEVLVARTVGTTKVITGLDQRPAGFEQLRKAIATKAILPGRRAIAAPSAEESQRHSTIACIIPCYNEQDSIARRAQGAAGPDPDARRHPRRRQQHRRRDHRDRQRVRRTPRAHRAGREIHHHRAHPRHG